MYESEYFLADIQFDYKTPAYPKHFVAAEPPSLGRDEMVDEQVIVSKLKRMYRELSGETLATRNIRATFYRDESGAREDCWVLTGDGFHVVVSAYSRNVIRFSGTIPCKELLEIPYERMGRAEYETAAAQIADLLITPLGIYGGDSTDAHGKEVKRVFVNAVADGHVCTMDIELRDGTYYECYFYNGVLKDIWYYADEGMYMVGSQTGWVADMVYINSAGLQFIPDYRKWDGNLHVIHRDESHAE